MTTPHVAAPAAGFAGLGLSSLALDAVAAAGYATPTPIQARAIPPALAGRDVIGCAATGTGKTAAFVLPIVERLAGKPGTRALVLAPTRELALQIGGELERFGAARGVKGVTVIGGVGMGNQEHGLRSRPSVVIATPGRLIDHLSHGTAKLGDIEVLVLDEADRMLDMGFKPQLDKILARLPKPRQTLLFSATMAGEVAAFARAHLKDPVRVEVERSGTTAARATQQVFLVSQNEKPAMLLALLAEGDDTTLVFTRTKRRADKVAQVVERAGHKVSRIHANRSQSQRQVALEGFKDGVYRVLIATDIAARGIDVAEIGHVVNFDLPHVAEDYVHRIGRTARAAATGRASSFASPEELELLAGIEKLTRTKLPRGEPPRTGAAFVDQMKKQAAGAHVREERYVDPRARTQHGQKPRHASGGHAQGGGRRQSHAPKSASGASSHAPKSASGASKSEGGEARKATLVGSWKPRRRR